MSRSKRAKIAADPEAQPALHRLLAAGPGVEVTAGDAPSARCYPSAGGCGGDLVFDPLAEGETVGGLHLIGWMMCRACGRGWHAGRKLCRVGGGKWRLAGGGRSLDAEGTRLRAEAAEGHVDVPALMARIARLPDLEAALRQIARGCEDPAEVARTALGVP